MQMPVHDSESPSCPECGGSTSNGHGRDCDECVEGWMSDNGFFE